MIVIYEKEKITQNILSHPQMIGLDFTLSSKAQLNQYVRQSLGLGI